MKKTVKPIVLNLDYTEESLKKAGIEKEEAVDIVAQLLIAHIKDGLLRDVEAEEYSPVELDISHISKEDIEQLKAHSKDVSRIEIIDENEILVRIFARGIENYDTDLKMNFLSGMSSQYGTLIATSLRDHVGEIRFKKGGNIVDKFETFEH